MLLSLVVVAVKITSDTVACFFFLSSLSLFLVALLFLSIKQSQYQCKKYKKKKEKQSDGGRIRSNPPPPTVHGDDSQKHMKIRCLHNSRSPYLTRIARSIIRKVLFLEVVWGRKEKKTLFVYVTKPISTFLCPSRFFSTHFSHFYLTH